MKTFLWFTLSMALAIIATMSRLLPASEVGTAVESDVATHMHEHLSRITIIKSLIVMGDLDGIRKPAAWLADHEAVAGLPANFEPYVGLMRGYAREVNNASDLKSAAISVSGMARTCSNSSELQDAYSTHAQRHIEQQNYRPFY